MKIKYYIILVTIILIPFLSFGQTESVDSNKYSLGFKLGYFYPTKTSFQKFYNQSLGDFPLSSITVELEYEYQKDLHIVAEIKIIHNKLVQYRDRRLFIIPTFIGMKYLQGISKSLNCFVGLAPGFYWIQMMFANVLEDDEYGNELRTHDFFYRSYYGIGIKPFIGFDIKMTESLRLGIQLDYDISHVGNADKGGLGNTGGLLTNLFLNFEF